MAQQGRRQADGTICRTGPGCKRHGNGAGRVSSAPANAADSIKQQIATVKAKTASTSTQAKSSTTTVIPPARTVTDADRAAYQAEIDRKWREQQKTLQNPDYQASVRRLDALKDARKAAAKAAAAQPAKPAVSTTSSQQAIQRIISEGSNSQRDDLLDNPNMTSDNLVEYISTVGVTPAGVRAVQAHPNYDGKVARALLTRKK
jgi:hypothetical protein